MFLEIFINVIFTLVRHQCNMTESRIKTSIISSILRCEREIKIHHFLNKEIIGEIIPRLILCIFTKERLGLLINLKTTKKLIN